MGAPLFCLPHGLLDLALQHTRPYPQPQRLSCYFSKVSGTLYLRAFACAAPSAWNRLAPNSQTALLLQCLFRCCLLGEDVPPPVTRSPSPELHIPLPALFSPEHLSFSNGVYNWYFYLFAHISLTTKSFVVWTVARPWWALSGEWVFSVDRQVLREDGWEGSEHSCCPVVKFSGLTLVESQNLK